MHDPNYNGRIQVSASRHLFREDLCQQLHQKSTQALTNKRSIKLDEITREAVCNWWRATSLSRPVLVTPCISVKRQIGSKHSSDIPGENLRRRVLPELVQKCDKEGNQDLPYCSWSKLAQTPYYPVSQSTCMCCSGPQGASGGTHQQSVRQRFWDLLFSLSQSLLKRNMGRDCMQALRSEEKGLNPSRWHKSLEAQWKSMPSYNTNQSPDLI